MLFVCENFIKNHHPVVEIWTKTCVGDLFCTTLYYTVDGEWGQWSATSPCNRTCGFGYQHRTRQCDNPKPQYGGENCTGLSVHIIPGCNAFPCPRTYVCLFFDFLRWKVPRTFEPARRNYETIIYDLNFMITGLKYHFFILKQKIYIISKRVEMSVMSPVDNGGLSEWSTWGLSVSPCGSTYKMRRRQCDNPKPAYRGAPCTQPLVEYQPVELPPCPGESSTHWTKWRIS